MRHGDRPFDRCPHGEIRVAAIEVAELRCIPVAADVVDARGVAVAAILVGHQLAVADAPIAFRADRPRGLKPFQRVHGLDEGGVEQDGVLEIVDRFFLFLQRLVEVAAVGVVNGDERTELDGGVEVVLRLGPCAFLEICETARIERIRVLGIQLQGLRAIANGVVQFLGDDVDVTRSTNS